MRFATVMVLVGMLIISLYLLIEVEYYSYSVSANPEDTPFLVIPKIGVNESINNKSVDYGIYFEPQSFKPTNGTTILFGHRTLHGSPFLKLDQLQPGDKIYVEWPGIGNVTYSMLNYTIVDASYMMPVEQGNNLFLITCYPLGSDEQRLIIQAEYETVTTLNPTPQSVQNPQAPMGVMLMGLLFVGGLVLGRAYPVADDRIWIFMATIALTLLLVFGYFFPVPTGALESALSDINSLIEF